MSMATLATKKLFLLTVVFTFERCVGSQAGFDSPKFRLPNGTILEDHKEIGHLYGTPFEIYCTGQAKDLEVTDFVLNRIPTVNVNETAIKIFDENLDQNYHIYQCKDTRTRKYNSIAVFVDSLPKVANFRCKSENLKSIDCVWTSNNVRMNCSWYYVEKGVSDLLCSLKNIWSDALIHCTWDKTNTLVDYNDKSSNENLTFMINSCNIWGCANQTFVIDHYAVLKLPQPFYLTLIGKTPLSVKLEVYVDVPFERTFDWDYKIIYLQSGIYEFQVSQYDHHCTETYVCHIEFKLPCGDTYYEVRVSVKSTAVGEEFWSEPAVISFVTDPEPDGSKPAVANPTCERRRVKITPDIMLYEMDKLRNVIIEEQKTLKGSIQSLKLKAGRINQP